MNKLHWKRTFITIYTGQALSLLGSAAVQFAVIWWLTAYTESAITLTLATIVSFLPNMLLGPFAGVWIDRYNRRTVMIAADGLVAISSIALGIAFWSCGTPPIWFVFIILFIRGIGNTFHSPAMQAAIPMFVPGEMLTKAGGWGNLITSVSTMLGPALGAGMMAVFPIAPIMLVDIIGAVLAIVCLLTISLPDIPGGGGKVHLLSDVKQGFLAMKENKPLMAVFIPVIFASMLYMPLGSLFPLLVRVHYMGGAGHNAVVEFIFSAGLMASSLVMGIWGGLKKRFLMILAEGYAMNKMMKFSGREDFRKWLSQNCSQVPAFGKAGGPETVKASEALEEALCFGWIDGQMQSIDENAYKNIFPYADKIVSGLKKTKHWLKNWREREK